MDLKRLRYLASTIPQPLYEVGQVVKLSPRDDEFEDGVMGLILAINAYNDDEKPYFCYNVQIEDTPPSEDIEWFDGFDFSKVITVVERQVKEAVQLDEVKS